MKLVSVNVGNEEPIEKARKSGKTGIFKQPVAAEVPVTFGGVEGDSVCDTRHHGGRDQAVYAFAAPDYQWWSRELGCDLEPGTFGENLTISGLESSELGIGDRLDVGPVVLEVTAPRIPCGTLAARMEDPLFVKRFRWAERPGVYCRVLTEGTVRAGDPVKVRRYAGETVSVLEIFRDFFEPELREESLRRQLAAPIAVRARVEKDKQLGDLLQREIKVREQANSVEKV
ncbi:MOSC domain-containing protein [soil metagenome]